MKIALLHDYLVQYGGAERVLEKLLEIYPNAPLYTLIYRPASFPPALQKQLNKRRIIVSSLQKFPLAKTHHRLYPLLMPYAIEQFDFNNYDLVLSDTTGFSKGIITRPQTLHVSYCHTPLRYAWDNSQRYIADYRYPSLLKPFIKWGIHYLRIWDRQAAERVDYFIANSHFVKKRIQKYYHREAKVIYPPIEVRKLKIAKRPKNYFLLVNRLLPYKKTEIAIRAFNKLKLPLVIVGRGPQEKYLKKIASNNIKFIGNVYADDLRRLYKSCQALIFPQEEDFGIAPVEVMASGRPIIAYRGGGALETVENGVSGLFFNKQTPESLVEAIEKFQKTKFSPQEIRNSVLRFDERFFKKQIKEFVEKKWQNFKK